MWIGINSVEGQWQDLPAFLVLSKYLELAAAHVGIFASCRLLLSGYPLLHSTRTDRQVDMCVRQRDLTVAFLKQL